MHRSSRHRSPSPGRDDDYYSRRRKHSSRAADDGGHRDKERDRDRDRRRSRSPHYRSSRHDRERDDYRERDRRDADKESRSSRRDADRDHRDRDRRDREERDRSDSHHDRSSRKRPRSPEPTPSNVANGSNNIQSLSSSAPRHALPPRPSASSLPERPVAALDSTALPAGVTPPLGSPKPYGSPAPASTATSKPLTEEEEKQKAKKERLEAWRKEREAKKALEEARARAQSVAAAYGAKTGLLTKPENGSDGPTMINAAGLKGLAARPDFAKSKIVSASALDDTAEQPTKKQLKKFALPPIDPLLKPGAGGKVGAGSDLEDDNDDDEDDVMAALQPAASAQEQDAMDVDDEEEDPLDAFMNGVQTEVKQVDEQDRKRFGKGKSKMPATVVGEEEGSGEEAEQEPDELDRAGMRAEDILALAAKKIKKKEMAVVDHAKVDYEPFRKAFYHPPPEVEEMSEEQADRLRMELDAIAVRGKDCPKPLTKWSHCGLPASCLEVIKKLEYAAPTAIQAQAIPAIMSGRDVIGVAKTGSGKTMAFLLPMFRHIKDQRPVEKMEGPIGIVMTPTRELAVQIYRESKPFLKALGLRAVCVYGGAPISEQIAEMKRTAEIVVATPGRMIDLLTANSGRVTNLQRVTYLVLDEADRMFDMGFEPQVMKIVNNIRPDRQTVLFSATFPKQMESLARKVLRNRPLEITVGGRSVVAAEIEQIVEVRSEDSKFNRLLEILGQTYNEDEDTRTLIFVDRQEAADDLLRELMRKGYPTMSLHGGKDQVDRDSTISDFKAGVVPIVTATSVAARGLDVKQLKLVINYDAPNHMEDYVHRAGRTGRAGNKGTCVTFITPEQDRYARDLITALKASKVTVSPELEALAEGFKEKLASGKAHAAGSGFGGKGLERLENDREKTLKAQRSAYGEGGDEEKGEESGAAAAAAPEEVKVQKGPAPTDDQHHKVADIHIEVKKGAAPDSVRDNKVKAEPAPGVAGAPPTAADTNETAAKLSATSASLEAAKAAAAKAGVDSVNVNKLQDLVAKFNAELKAKRMAQREGENQRERKPKDPDATDYHAIVPINDFPQKSRWSVTNRDFMSRLIESTGASITAKGVFYAPGKEPVPGEPPKLQLLIESNDEYRVEHAVREIKRQLLESSQAALEAEARGPAGGTAGRYSVL